MEIKLNLAILAALAVIWGSLSLVEAEDALDPRDARTHALLELEDAYATRRDDPALAEELARAYLEGDRPELAVAALSSATPSVLDDPAVGHQLSRAYERSGRVPDALATASTALARCARSLGSSHSNAVTAIPARRCSERTYSSIDVHQAALRRMVEWGVTDPRRDPRTARAYGLSVRAARILSASR
jgi:predicted Zn-dependent protease